MKIDFNIHRVLIALFLYAICWQRSFAQGAGIPGCLNRDGLVAWWSGNNTTTDLIGGISGEFQGNAEYTDGKVGKAFRFRGANDQVALGNPTALHLQNFTIEFWVRRAELTRTSDSEAGAGIFSGGAGGYSVTILHGGSVGIGHVGIDRKDTEARVSDLEWHHVAVIKNGNVTTIYVDGVESATASTPFTYTFDRPFAIGATGEPFGGQKFAFLGEIDELAVFSRPLGASEVRAIYERGAFGKCLGAFDASLTMESRVTEPGLPVRGQLNLTTGVEAVSNAVVRVSPTAGGEIREPRVSVGTVEVVEGRIRWTVPVFSRLQTPSLEWTQTFAAGAVPQEVIAEVAGTDPVGNRSTNSYRTQVTIVGPAANKPPGLVAWWRLEGGGLDEVSGATAEALGEVPFGAAKVGQGARFEGTGAVLSVGSSAALRTQSPTIEAWVRRANPTKASVSQVAGAIFSGGANNYGVGMHDDGRLYFAVQANSAVESTARITDTGWHHIVVGRDGAAVRFFIDGALVSTASYAVQAAFETPFAIGGLGTAFVGDRYGFWGDIDEVSVYDRMLGDSEVADLYRADRFGKTTADLVLHASGPASVTAGSEFDVRLAVRNLGRTAASGVVVSNRIPDGVRWIGGSADRGSLVLTNGFAVWSLPEAPGDRTTSAFLRFAAPAASGLVFNVATLTASSGNAAAGNDTAVVRILGEGACGAGPDGLVAWVTGDDGLVERISGQPLVSGGTFGETAGRVGRAYSFNGRSGSGLALARSTALELQNFSADAWIRRASATAASQEWPYQLGTILGVDEGGPQFSVTDLGALSLGRTGFGRVETAPGRISDTGWHHVAVTKSGSSVTFYVDGLEAGRATFADPFAFTGPWSLGQAFPGNRNPFFGDLDEVALYNRVVSVGEGGAGDGLGGSGRCPEDLVLETVVPVPALVAVGEDFTYRLRVTNRGANPATGVRVTNRFEGLVLVGATNGAGVAVSGTAPGLLAWNVGTVAPAGSVDLSLTLRADAAVDGRISGDLVRDGNDLTLANNSFAADFSAQPISVSVVSVSSEVTEGAPATVAVRVSPGTTRTVSVRFSTVDGTAVAGRDYVPTNGVVEFAPGTSERLVQVRTLDDSIHEGTEDFRVALTNVVGAVVLAAEAPVSVADNEAPPQISVDGGRILEGNSGRSQLRFEVRLSTVSERAVSVAFATTNDTARSGSDYLATNGVATVPPGRFSTSFEVTVLGDRSIEANESFLVVLGSPTNGVLRLSTAAGLVLNDDVLAGQVAGFQWSGVPTNRLENGATVPAVLSAVDGNGAVVTDFSAAVTVGAYPPGFRPSTLVVSEILFGTGDAVELQNVDTNALDVSGWRVSLYDGTRWPLPRVTAVVPSGWVLPGRATLVVAEGTGVSTFPTLRVGAQIQWKDLSPSTTAFDPMAVLVQDASGRVVDFVALDAAEPSQIALPASVVPGAWSGPAFQTGPVASGVRRRGNSDGDTASDWVGVRTSGLGQVNSELTLPFADVRPVAVTPSPVLDFTNGVWAGAFTLERPVARFALYADDGNGGFGVSTPIEMALPNDLSVRLVAAQPQVAFGGTAEFTLSVTNPGPATATNVFVATALDPFVTSSGRIIFLGVRPNVTFSGGGLSGLQMRWIVGDLPPGTGREIVFVQNVFVASGTVLAPTRMVHEARIQSAAPDANPANDVSAATVEAAAATTTVASATSWWTGDDSRDTATTHVAVPSGIPARLVGAVPGPGRVDAGWVFPGLPGGVVVDPQPGLDWTDPSRGATLEGWIRVDPAGGTAHVPVVGRHGTQEGWQFSIVEGRPLLWTLQGGLVTGVLSPQQVTPPLVDGLWHHLQVVRVPESIGGTTQIFLDGLVVAEGTLPSFDTVAAGTPLVFGSDPEGRTLRGAMDEWAQYVGHQQAFSTFQAGANGKALFQLAIVPPAVVPAASFDLTYPLELVITNQGVGASPATRFAVDASNVGALTVQASQGTQQQEPPPRLAITGTLGEIPAGGSARLSITFNPTNPVVAPVLVVDAFSSSRRGRNNSRTLTIAINPDTDGDGMDDLWEIRYGLNRLLGSDGLLDADGDGLLNRDEYLAATNPADPTSALRLQSESIGGTGVRVRFQVGPGRNWQLLRSPRIGPDAVWSLVTSGSTGAEGEVKQIVVSGEEAAFVQVVITRP